jgi:thiamine pyrophosphate-dependent acetolactate synthase large subunit-like protein
MLVGVDLKNPDSAKMAESIVIFFGVCVEDPCGPDGGFGGMLAHNGPALLDVFASVRALNVL